MPFHPGNPEAWKHDDPREQTPAERGRERAQQREDTLVHMKKVWEQVQALIRGDK